MYLSKCKVRMCGVNEYFYCIYKTFRIVIYLDEDEKNEKKQNEWDKATTEKRYQDENSGISNDNG